MADVEEVFQSQDPTAVSLIVNRAITVTCMKKGSHTVQKEAKKIIIECKKCFQFINISFFGVSCHTKDLRKLL